MNKACNFFTVPLSISHESLENQNGIHLGINQCFTENIIPYNNNMLTPV